MSTEINNIVQKSKQETPSATLKKNFVQRFVAKANENVCISILTVILSIVGVLTTIEKGYILTNSFINWQIRIKADNDYKKIYRLKPEGNIDAFINVLGQPNITYNNKEGFKEYIFIYDSFYVQVVVSKDGSLYFYSITTRTSSFQPSFNIVKANGIQNITLGKTTYSELSLEYPSNLSNFPNTYMESYNALSPPQYVLSDNPNGFFSDQKKHLLKIVNKFVISSKSDTTRKKDFSLLFRKSSTFNTITFYNDMFDCDNFCILVAKIYGPKSEILNEYNKWKPVYINKKRSHI